MMKEIEEEKANEKNVFSSSITDTPHALAALQKLWYGAALQADGLLAGMDYQDCLQSTKCIAAADGLDAMEAQWLRDRCVLLGLDSKQINTLFNLDARLEGDEVPAIMRKAKASAPQVRRRRRRSAPAAQCTCMAEAAEAEAKRSGRAVQRASYSSPHTQHSLTPRF